MDNGASSYRRFLAGDDNGLAEIIRAYRDGLIFYLNGFVNDIQLAEELAEDVFIRIAVKQPAFREQSAFKTWLYAIGRNEAYRILRRRKLIYVPLDEAPDVPDVQSAPETAYLGTERARALHRCLGKVKSEYHQALWLYYFENMSVSEIACVMHKSAHNVETLLYRARKAVKQELAAEGFDDEKL